jgi:hypothetical protein
MKSNPLAAALSTREPATHSPEATVPPNKTRPGKRQVSVYLPIPVHEYLRRLAFESRRSIHSILQEGLDRVLADHGTSTARLVEEQQESEQA